MAIIGCDELVKLLKPGDILLTRNPAGLGKAINWAQQIGQGDQSEFGHIAIVVRNPETDKVDGTIAESVKKISYNHACDYLGARICIMRHKGMTAYRYAQGMKEIVDNIGQIYPAHRLVVHLVDACRAWFVRKISGGKVGAPWFRWSSLMVMDWPVCSELGAQFMLSSGLESGLPYDGMDWRGVNPDHFDDARLSREDLWTTPFIGTLV